MIDSISEKEALMRKYYDRNRVEKAVVILRQDGQEHIFEFGTRLTPEQKLELSKIFNK